MVVNHVARCYREIYSSAATYSHSAARRSFLHKPTLLPSGSSAPLARTKFNLWLSISNSK